MVLLAVAEWARYGRQTVIYSPDQPPRTEQQGVKERDAPERIHDYWASVGHPERSGLDNVAWSAAFVSWDIASAGVPRDLFSPDQRHTIYVERMVERTRRPGAVFIAYRPSERAPQVGDLICASRAGSGTTLDNLNRGAAHCDIVVEVKPGWACGDRRRCGHSVSRSVFPLDGNGFLSPISGRPVFAVDREQIALGRTRMSWPYDYIVIGAGSAGCAIANRLAENMALRILILEAGPPDTSFKLKMPAGFASLGGDSPYNWHYETVPQKHCNDRRMYWPRGKTLGGSRRSTPCSMCAAMPRTTTTGASSATRAGATTTCCPSSRRPSTTSAATTSFTALTDR